VSNLLAVDFDSFFPNPLGSPDRNVNDMLYDWGHRENTFFIEMIWGARAQTFLLNGVPLPDLNGLEQSFWPRFRFTRNARLFYADSNACAVSRELTGRRRLWESVWLYDAHHDSGYKQNESAYELLSAGAWACENWMVLYAGMGAELHVRYPQWRAWALDAEPQPVVRVDRAVDDGSTPDVVFDRVFVCRSGAWVPPWHDIDARFEQFVACAPVRHKQDVQPGGVRRRDFDLSVELAQAERQKALLQEMMRP